MANVSTIEGIRVSADHWIGGSRVPSSDMFLDLSPIDLETLAMVARGGKKEADEIGRASCRERVCELV